ncbi:MAG: hypothetical protein M2R45_01616 [Verrucomicrobia subdivision 3 bacterium]|nr:hypothetical protein [Limisphaerales bacterium]MCS1412768.1 hypothetical protein [Limisphaerales bacterium]
MGKKATYCRHMLRLYRLLPSGDQEAQLRAEAALMCPQIFKRSRQRGSKMMPVYLLT